MSRGLFLFPIPPIPWVDGRNIFERYETLEKSGWKVSWVVEGFAFVGFYKDLFKNYNVGRPKGRVTFVSEVIPTFVFKIIGKS